MIIYSALYRSIDENGNAVVNPLGLAKRAALMAPTLARYGCNAWLWPPLTMSQSGAADNADGYGKVRDLDVGQWSGAPTRWGYAQDVLAANRAIHRNGMMALEDAVIHQYEGSLPIYERGSTGATDHTLFPKPASSFVPQVAPDQVFDAEGNASFGQMVSYQNGLPKGYMLWATIQVMKWRRDTFGLDGGRLDDTKGEAASVSQRIIERVGGWWFGECFVGGYDGQFGLRAWIIAAGYKRTYDFQMHWWIKAVCEGTASCRVLLGFMDAADIWQYLVLFVESADTDGNNNENVRWNKIWGYQLIFTLPCAAAIPYAGDYEKYGLAPQINNLMWISTMFAFGKLRWEHVEDELIVWSRDGQGGDVGWSPGLVCGFNRDPNNSRTLWVRTVFSPNTHLHDYSGSSGDVWTNGFGWAEITVPASGYVCYAPAGVNRPIPITPRPESGTGDFTNFDSITVTL